MKAEALFLKIYLFDLLRFLNLNNKTNVNKGSEVKQFRLLKASINKKYLFCESCRKKLDI